MDSVITDPVAGLAGAQSRPVTQLLNDWTNGHPQALDSLLPLVYAELRSLAERHLRCERDAHTLAPAALVHEAYLRLTGGTAMQFASRSQFYGLMSHLMRHVLVDHARARLADKRGGGRCESLDEIGDAVAATLQAQHAASPLDLLALDQALRRLEGMDARQGRVVELRFFGGLSVEETAQTLGISEATVKREWVSARAWLLRELRGAAA